MENGKQIKKAHKELIVETSKPTQPPKIEKIVIKKRKILKEIEELNYDSDNEEFEVKIKKSNEMGGIMSIINDDGDQDFSMDKEMKIADVDDGDDDDAIDDDDDDDDDEQNLLDKKDNDFKLANHNYSNKKPVNLHVVNKTVNNKEIVVKKTAVASAPPPSKKPKKESKLRKKLQKMYNRF